MLYYYIVYYIILYFIMLYHICILWYIVLLYYDKLCSIMIYEHYRYGIDTQISATMVLIHVSECDAHQNLRLKLVIPENIWLRICWSGVILWILISSTSMGMHVHQHSPTVILFIELYLWSSPFIFVSSRGSDGSVQVASELKALHKAPWIPWIGNHGSTWRVFPHLGSLFKQLEGTI